jgi:hypothetical protein
LIKFKNGFEFNYYQRPAQVLFSRDGNYLYSGARRDARLICWDVRCGGGPLYSMRRDAAATNQRLGFSIDPSNRHLASGGADGAVRVRAARRRPAGPAGLWPGALRFGQRGQGRGAAAGRIEPKRPRPRGRKALRVAPAARAPFSPNACPSPLRLPFRRAAQVFDLRDGSEVGSFRAAADTVSGCDFHPVMGLPLLATASGHRRYPLAPSDEDGGSGDGDEDGGGGVGPPRRRRRRAAEGGGGGGDEWGLGRDCNCLRLWRLEVGWEELAPAGGEAAPASADCGAEGGRAAQAPGAGADPPGGGGGGALTSTGDGAAAGAGAGAHTNLPFVRV